MRKSIDTFVSQSLANTLCSGIDPVQSEIW